MCPHPNNLDRLQVFQDLIYESVLDVDASGACSGQITDKSFVGRRILIRIQFQDF